MDGYIRDLLTDVEVPEPNRKEASASADPAHTPRRSRRTRAAQERSLAARARARRRSLRRAPAMPPCAPPACATRATRRDGRTRQPEDGEIFEPYAQLGAAGEAAEQSGGKRAKKGRAEDDAKGDVPFVRRIKVRAAPFRDARCEA